MIMVLSTRLTHLGWVADFVTRFVTRIFAVDSHAITLNGQNTTKLQLFSNLIKNMSAPRMEHGLK